MNIIGKRWNNFDVLEIQGRIDGLTSAELKRYIDQTAVAGQRKIILDFAGVTFMSSAGLRIIIHARKSLSAIGGELIMIAVPAQVSEVFRVSGMDHFIRILPDFQSLLESLDQGSVDLQPQVIDLDGLHCEWLKLSDKPGGCFMTGNPGKLTDASFEEPDNVVISPSEMKFGAGLAALGEIFADFKPVFGEAIIIGHHFFSYPAVVRPMVDYTFYSSGSDYFFNFLYGFGFTGDFSGILRFDASGDYPDITRLAGAVGKMTSARLFGVVILAMSGGLQWMHLKKTPVAEHPIQSGSVFDTDHFHEWFNFSPEEDDLNKTIIACGVVAMEKNDIPDGLQQVFPAEGNLHLHAAVFENGLWSNDIKEFGSELMRVANDFEIQKVVHLLPSSRLINGYIGIINLENS
ncbi:MAG: STAS domain-containing protein [Bacteroidota bacterium]